VTNNNGELISHCLERAGSPLVLQVVNPANKMSLHYGNAAKSVPVTQAVWATVNLAGYDCAIAPEAIVPAVIGVHLVANFFQVSQPLNNVILYLFYMKYALYASC